MLNFDRDHGTKRIWIWMLLSLWTVVAVGALAPRKTLAQEDATKTAGADKPADAPAPANKPPAKEQQSFFSWFLESSGWIGIIILVLSIYFIATVSRLFI